MLRKRLVESRKKMNMTQQELADKLHITRATYAQYEIGRRAPDYETLENLADFFEVSIDYLLGRTSIPNPNVIVAGQKIELTPEEYRVFEEMKKHPKFVPMFHDLATNPEKKVKALIKMWEALKVTLEEDELEHGEIIED